MSFANQLIELTDINCREIESTPTIRKLLSGDVSEKHYVSFMTDIYPIVLHFCPIMAAAAGRCAHRQATTLLSEEHGAIWKERHIPWRIRFLEGFNLHINSRRRHSRQHGSRCQSGE